MAAGQSHTPTNRQHYTIPHVDVDQKQKNNNGKWNGFTVSIQPLSPLSHAFFRLILIEASLGI